MAEQGARQMLPEVQKFVESVEAAIAARVATVEAAEQKYPERHSCGEVGRREYNAYSEEINKAYAKCSGVQAAAWGALKVSSDPLVKWIAENCTEYREQAQSVLAALPATVDELDDLADKNDWCSVWDEFRRQAINAGVMPGIKPPSPAMKAVFERIDREGCCPMDPGARRRIGKALDALIQEALTAASATEAKAVEVTA
ncbi:hypothetical protein FE633_13710 [Streptomyces montanus]|uniref:Uncharacterized protein n=1 Tax=Streptomyces montanus TaxID=2580423 RepID=A0A5R9FUW4_9ACTN|nr:hypothetical protein [Streptomyces montanus]TLS45806.1 hypothetical protein FE633_13710 [Streptomyces montanus]